MYNNHYELPIDVRQMPQLTQDLYRAAYHSALDWYGEESKAHRTARCAIRNQASLNLLDTTVTPAQ